VFPFSRAVFVSLLAMLAIYDLAYVVMWLSRSPEPPFDDFFGLWTFGRFAATAGPGVYDPVALAAFQRSLDSAFTHVYPCPYPPSFLLALMPLGKLPLAPAYVCWIAGGLGLYLAAALGRGWRSLAGAALLLAPTTLLTLVAGQNGFLTAALLIGGLRGLKQRPILSGILFGLLTYKFQFGLLVPIVLLATRAWRPIVVACLTVACTTLLSTMTLGPSIWLAWLHSAASYGDLLQANQARLSHAMPTFVVSFGQIGAPAWVAFAVQALIVVGLAAAMWRAAASSWDDRTVAMAILATLIATPYAFTYDMPVLAGALVIEAGRRQRLCLAVSLGDIAMVGLTFAVIVAMSKYALPFAAPALLVWMFCRVAGFGDVRAATSPPSPQPRTLLAA
jgi:hypothetical protein